jgi:hypothetical protein
MTDIDGKPVRRRYSGEVSRHRLAEGDDPVVIAKRLTLAIWRSNTGGDASGGFNRPLRYPDSVWSSADHNVSGCDDGVKRQVFGTRQQDRRALMS